MFGMIPNLISSFLTESKSDWIGSVHLNMGCKRDKFSLCIVYCYRLTLNFKVPLGWWLMNEEIRFVDIDEVLIGNQEYN